jgi:hypothetical protein
MLTSEITHNSVDHRSDLKKNNNRPAKWKGVVFLVITGVFTYPLVKIISKIEKKIFHLSLQFMKIRDRSFKTRLDQFQIEHPELFNALENKKNLLHRILFSRETEKEVLTHLRDNYDISTSDWEEILKGGFVKIQDDGKLYDFLQSKAHAARYSSHVSTAKQYAIRGRVFKELLFGKVETKEGSISESYTWFQLERSPFSWNPWRALCHSMDYVDYAITGRNQGPYGQSSFTELGRKQLEIKALDYV